jgi:hypothetical protein
MPNPLMAIRLKMEPVRELVGTLIGGGYTPIGSAFAHTIRQIFVQNLTNALLMFSLDGVNDHFPLPPSGFLLLDVTSNKSIGQGYFIAEGTRIYVDEIGVPTTGSVYVSVMYADD